MNSKEGFKFAIVDIEDLDKVNQYTWYAAHDGNTHYAQTILQEENGKKRLTRMHRLILNLEISDPIVDHKNHNGLDNRKNNLRLCNQTQNNGNMIKQKNCSSQYKGVVKYIRNGKIGWRAGIMFNRKAINLGNFKTEEEAALHYNDAAKIVFGEFALLNKIK